MGFLSLIGTCGACARPFMSNPTYVPSLRLDDGQQLIFCQPCVAAANPERPAAACRPSSCIPSPTNPRRNPEL